MVSKAQAKEMVGSVGHLSLYGFVSEDKVILQCLFFDVSRDEPIHVTSKTLLLLVSVPSSFLRILRETYLSFLERDEDEKLKRIGERNAALAYLLTEVNDIVAVLSRAFVPLALYVVDDLEIVAAKFLERPVSGFYEVLSTLDVARVRAVGGDTTKRRRDDFVHVHKRVRREYGSGELAFSVRVGGRKVVFDSPEGRSVVGGVDREILELFSIRDVTFACHSLRLATPKGFVAVAFADDQCLLLLREAVFCLFRRTYAGFSGLRPMFDCLGPDFYTDGGPRSVFFPGFPNLTVYSVPWGHRLIQETCQDAIDEILSECGLPDILGGAGKHRIELVSPLPTDLPEEDMGIFYSSVRRFRLNGNHFSSHELGETEVINVYAADRDLYRVIIPNLRVEILRRCVSTRDFPLVFGERGRNDPGEVCTRFVERLRYQSSKLYVYIRCLEGFISHHVTSICGSSGLPWVLVKNDNEFYMEEDGRGEQSSRVETCVQTVFGCYWKRLFGSVAREPRCIVTGREASLLVAVGDVLFSPFGLSGAGPGRCLHWTDVAGRFLADSVTAAFRPTSDANELEEIIRDKMRNVLLELAAHRHDVSFWVEKFPPGKHVVEEHSGIFDCNEFSGVWLSRDKIAVQSLETALHDAIDYEVYVKKIFSYLKLCLGSVVQRKKPSPRVSMNGRDSDITATIDAIETWEKRLLADYTVLFRIN